MAPVLPASTGAAQAPHARGAHGLCHHVEYRTVADAVIKAQTHLQKCLAVSTWRRPPCGHDAGWGSCGSLRARGGAVRTGIAVGLDGEARKGCGLTMVWWLWGRRL